MAALTNRRAWDCPPEVEGQWPGERGSRFADAQHPPSATLPFAALLQRAQAAAVDFRVTHVYRPHRPDAPLSVYGTGSAALARDNADRIFLNPYSGAVLRLDRASDWVLRAGGTKG